MASGDNGSDEKPKGFSALSTLVSDIDHTISEPKKPAQATSAQGAPVKSSVSRAPPSRPAPPPSGDSLRSLTWLTVLILSAAGGLYAYFYFNSDAYEGYTPQNPSYAEASDATSAARQPTADQSASKVRPLEEKPPIGHNRVLSVSQIRYCLAEDIRMEAAESVLDDYNVSQIDRFNEYVKDYNYRCGEYRYYDGAMTTARSDTLLHRDEIRSEGIARFTLQKEPQLSLPEATAAKVPELGEPENITLQQNTSLIGEAAELDAADLSAVEEILEPADQTLESYAVVTGLEEQSSLPDQSAVSVASTNNRAVSSTPIRPRVNPEIQVVEAVPIRSPRPSFPRRAAERGISGACDVVFDLNASGKPYNVVARCSNELFVKEAERAIARTDFSPKLVDGRPVEQLNTVYPLEFVLD